MPSMFAARRRCVLATALLTVAVQPGVASPAAQSGPGNMVPACATPDRLLEYLKSRNPGLPGAFTGIAADYRREGQALGVRWDYAFFQMMVDTASLTFRRPNGGAAAVKPQQYNFAGLGATGGTEPGESFPDVATGVRAHLQHVLLYSGVRIPTPAALRTRKVQEWAILQPWQRQLGRPVTFADLAAKWSPADPSYGPSIAAVAHRFYAGFCGTAVAAPDTASAGQLLAQAAADRERGEGAVARSSLGTTGFEHSAQVPAARKAPTASAAPPVREAKAAPPPLPPADPETEAISTLVTGRTFVLDASFGTKIPISFRADGTMLGKAGSLSMMLGAAADEGKWWVEKGRLCKRWKVWLERETQCLRLRKIGEVIHWTRDDGKTGTARLAAR